MLDFARVQDIIRRVAHRFDPQVLEAMLDLPPLSVAAFADPTGIAAWLYRLQGRLNATGLGRPRYRPEAQAPVDDTPGGGRKSGVEGQSESVRVATGGCGTINKTHTDNK